jgi:hypothetical protein
VILAVTFGCLIETSSEASASLLSAEYTRQATGPRVRICISGATGREPDATSSIYGGFMQGDPMLWTIAKEAAANWSSHRDSRQGAALAYYSIFSLGPIIVIAIAVAGFFSVARLSAARSLPRLRACSATPAQKQYRPCWPTPGGRGKACSQP